MRKSLFEVSNFLEDRGFDIYPVKQENGMYKCDLYIYDKFSKTGDVEYSSWTEAQKETSFKIYEAIKDK